jgi:hypothetical protein
VTCGGGMSRCEGNVSSLKRLRVLPIRDLSRPRLRGTSPSEATFSTNHSIFLGLVALVAHARLRRREQEVIDR